MQADLPPTTLTEQDIDRVVRAFYGRVQQDALLGPIFNRAIGDWDHHLGKLQAFWSSVLLGTGRYQGQPMAAHLRQEPHMTPQAFARWLALWRDTSEELLEPGAARLLQEKATRIAESLSLGITFQRDRSI